MKKLLSILLVAVLLLSLSATVFAEPDTYSSPNLIVRNATYDKTYTWYRIFTADSYESSGTTYVTYFTDATRKTVIDNMNDTENAAYDAGCPFEVGDSAQPGKVGSEAGYAVTIKEGKTPEQIIEWLQAATASASDSADNKNFNVLALASENLTVSAGEAAAYVPSGYYYVTTSLGTAVTIDTVFDDGPTVIWDKNPATPNGPEQHITKEGTTEEFASDVAPNPEAFADTLTGEHYPGKVENDSAVGKMEELTVNFNAVNYCQDYVDDDNDPATDPVYEPVKVNSWTMVDAPTNLDIDASSVKVYIGDSDSPLASGTYTVDKNTETGALTVVIPWVEGPEDTHPGSHLYAPPSTGDDQVHIPVKITYNAMVLPGAATEPAPTAVTVTYDHSLASNPTTTGTTPLGTDSTTTYTYAFELVKIDGENKSLLGAEFQLGIYVDDDGDAATADVFTPFTFIQTLVDDDSSNPDHYVYRLATPAEVAAGSGTTTIALAQVNLAEIRGLDKATYKLKETKAPDGYNGLSEDVEVKPTDESGVLTKIEADDTTLTPQTVVNQAGSELPATGGVGTTLFYIFGAILFLGAGAILIARRKVADR